MVDEFQDTNETQLNFLELLTENFAGNNQNLFLQLVILCNQFIDLEKAEVEIFSRVQKKWHWRFKAKITLPKSKLSIK